MNLHPASIYAADATVQTESTGRVWVFIGTAMIAMSRDEARVLAKRLQDATGGADPLVKLEGLQSANEDLASEHATLGKPA
jgi:hypothetical protein